MAEVNSMVQTTGGVGTRYIYKDIYKDIYNFYFLRNRPSIHSKKGNRILDS